MKTKPGTAPFSYWLLSFGGWWREIWSERKSRLPIAPAVIGLILMLAVGALASAKYKVLYGFKGGSDGGGLFGSVTLDANGNLYGGTVGGGDGGGTIFELMPGSRGWTKSVVYGLDYHSDGGNPSGGLVFDAESNLYGTTSSGGPLDFGTVFQLTPGSGGWSLNVLMDYGSTAGLTMDAAGNLYGASGDIVFELTPGSNGWSEKVLYTFGTKKGDGGITDAAMIVDASGNLYGTTQAGGNRGPWCSGGGGCGVVFEVSPASHGSWKEHIPHRFAAFRYDGQYAVGGVVMDAAGNLYGTTIEGGTHRNEGICLVGCGTIYRLTPDSKGHWKETILYNFPHLKDGVGPTASLVFDKAGNLYGIAGEGGNACGCGVVFKLSPRGHGKWKYTVVHRFDGKDGNAPFAPLTIDGKGNLYGTTTFGGQGGYGVVFEITP